MGVAGVDDRSAGGSKRRHELVHLPKSAAGVGNVRGLVGRGEALLQVDDDQCRACEVAQVEVPGERECRDLR